MVLVCSYADEIDQQPKPLTNGAQRILFMMHSGSTDAAIQLYEDLFNATGKHNTELLQQMGLTLLEQGSRSSDPEEQLMTLFGAGIAFNEKTMHILKTGLNSRNPQLQLIALNFLARYQNDEADEYINLALRSNNLLVRLEAAHQLALKKHPKAVGQIESLMAKLDPELHAVFPQLFAMVGDTASSKILKKLLANPYEAVRIEAILSSAKYGRDDMLPKIRNLATHQATVQLEAAARALGDLKDEVSVPRLELLSTSTSPNVRLTALLSLIKLGRKEYISKIAEMAKEGDLFAIYSLGDIPGTENLLYQLAQRGDFNVRLNAALGLLERKDVRCNAFLKDLLIKDSRDLGFVKSTSKGRGLIYWRAVASARQHFEELPLALELSLNFREDVLRSIMELSEAEFIKTCRMIFDAGQNDLVPTAIYLLENLQSEGSIALLKEYQQKVGVPLIRNYCNLALYKLNEEGRYDEILREWINLQIDTDLIQLRPFVPWEARDDQTPYVITPHETSRLLVEAIEAFAKKQDDKGINVLIEAIRRGKNKNKYALAGLLIRASL